MFSRRGVFGTRFQVHWLQIYENIYTSADERDGQQYSCFRFEMMLFRAVSLCIFCICIKLSRVDFVSNKPSVLGEDDSLTLRARREKSNDLLTAIVPYFVAQCTQSKRNHVCDSATLINLNVNKYILLLGVDTQIWVILTITKNKYLQWSYGKWLTFALTRACWSLYWYGCIFARRSTVRMVFSFAKMFNQCNFLPVCLAISNTSTE